jgi:hypothetical protein
MLKFFNKKYIYFIILLALFVFVVILCFLDEITIPEIISFIEFNKITIPEIISFIIAVVGLRFFYIRLGTQIKQRFDDRFNSAINLLGSNQTSARTGGIYVLHKLAKEKPEYKKQIIEILSSHIRSKTNEAEYKKENKEKPSNEIQTTINLLFDSNIGLNDKDNNIDLNDAYLKGADFKYTNCQGVDFSGADCQKADFSGADCQKADFSGADCKEAYFSGADCQGAYFEDTNCEKAHFSEANLQGTDFSVKKYKDAQFNNTEYDDKTIFSDENMENLIKEVGVSVEQN